jgi:hypothetical protein
MSFQSRSAVLENDFHRLPSQLREVDVALLAFLPALFNDLPIDELILRQSRPEVFEKLFHFLPTQLTRPETGFFSLSKALTPSPTAKTNGADTTFEKPLPTLPATLKAVPIPSPSFLPTGDIFLPTDELKELSDFPADVVSETTFLSKDELVFPIDEPIEPNFLPTDEPKEPSDFDVFCISE